MDYLKNHCWCRDSIWGGHYDCQIIVGLDCYQEYNQTDWDNVLDQEKYFSQKRYEEAKEMFVGKEYYTDDFHRGIACKTINVPKPDVVQWLHDNVPSGKNGEPMFAYGSKDYSSEDGACSYSFFFQRRKDAMKFIKAWSIYKKPVYYTQYFTDVRKKLNLQTMKYEDR